VAGWYHCRWDALRRWPAGPTFGLPISFKEKAGYHGKLLYRGNNGAIAHAADCSAAAATSAAGCSLAAAFAAWRSRLSAAARPEACHPCCGASTTRHTGLSGPLMLVGFSGCCAWPRHVSTPHAEPCLPSWELDVGKRANGLVPLLGVRLVARQNGRKAASGQTCAAARLVVAAPERTN